MDWKDWAYWVKGGIIGLILSPIFAFYINSKFICSIPKSPCGLETLEFFYIIIGGIILASLIGWIISKIKTFSYAHIGGIIASIIPLALICIAFYFIIGDFFVPWMGGGFEGLIITLMIPVALILYAIGYFIGKKFDKKKEKV